TYWSPYQRLDVMPLLGSDGELLAWNIATNDYWYQRMVNLSPQFIERHPAFFGGIPTDELPYNLPYKFRAGARRVLILGAGSGNDVAAAVRNTQAQITAVEIDPLILRLGRELHFEQPYSSPRVHVIVNDARSYLENSSDRYDLIVFSLLDSHTTSSNYANIRIDNYVYTREAFEAAKRMLAPDGVMVLKFWVDSPWIAGRLNGLLREVFRQEPIRIQSQAPLQMVKFRYETPGRFFIVGPRPQLDDVLKAEASLNDLAERAAKIPMPTPQ